MDPGQPAPSAQEAPASYIAIHPDGSRSVIPSSPAAVVDGAWQMERALGDFNASEYGFEYASLKQGDVVHVVAGVVEDQGYMYGRNSSGSMGCFPSTFLKFPQMRFSVLPTNEQQESGGARREGAH